MIEIDLVRSASDAILDSSAVAEKGGPLFGCLSVCLAVTRFALHKYANVSPPLRPRSHDGEKQRRTIRIGGLTLSGEHPDKVRSEPAGCSELCKPDANASRVSLIFFPRSPPERNDRRTSLCSEEGRSKATEG